MPGKDIKIITVDAVKDGMAALADGKINYIVECNPLLGHQLMDLAKKVLAGEEVPERVVTEETTFNQEQAKPRSCPTASTEPHARARPSGPHAGPRPRRTATPRPSGRAAGTPPRRPGPRTTHDRHAGARGDRRSPTPGATPWSRCAASPSRSPASWPCRTSTSACFPGEVHALMGENGAGKSTLIKALTGVYTIDAGTILVARRASTPSPAPAAAQDAGISTVYQEVNLCPNLTVAENMLLGREPRRFGAHRRAGR